MKIKDLTDWMIMPQTIEPQGLIHKPGTGPNNRFDFKNKGNNRANEYFSGPRTLGQPGYGTAHPLHPDNVKSLSDRFKEKYQSLFNKKKEEPKREWTAFEMACMEGGHPIPEDNINEKCWDGYRQAGMKNKGGRQVPNCVPEEAAGVGIITKQNTTVDVKPGETQRQAAKFGFKLDKKGLPPKLREMWTEWQEFKENFADGRVKGKSRPGRVKRAGASCKGSVSSLRAKAKKYSGERAKMYHWCANMKSGRKKS